MKSWFLIKKSAFFVQLALTYEFRLCKLELSLYNKEK